MTMPFISSFCKRLLLLSGFLWIAPGHGYSQTVKGWESIPPQTDASFRGLSVIDDAVAWISGSKGWVGRTINGGKAWTFQQVPGFETFDFRSIYGFDANTAVIANAGAPGYVLRTTDGGVRWDTVYANADPAIFMDGIDFWNMQEGVIYGDPLNGHMLLLSTVDGGKHWTMLPEAQRPVLAAGEASFAASGTGIRCMDRHQLLIATGGIISRLWLSDFKRPMKRSTWQTLTPPVLQGRSSIGIFSVAFLDRTHGLVVGGDYLSDTVKTDHVFYTNDGGKHWQAPPAPTRGYRECVEYISATTVLATGPAGTDVSYDGGLHWQPLSDETLYHAVRKARNGSLVIGAGGKGKIAVIQF